MGNYQTAKGVLGFLAFAGWATVALSIYVLMVGVDSGELLPAAILAAPFAIGGFLLIATSVVAHSAIVTAEATTESLAELRALREAMASMRREMAGGGARELVKTYKGRRIERDAAGRLCVGDVTFRGILDAEAYIDRG